MDTIKGGEFIIKESKSDAIFISEEFNEEQQMIKESIVDFIDQEVLPYRERFEAKDYAFTEEIMKKIRGIGPIGNFGSRRIWWIGYGFCYNHVGL